MINVLTKLSAPGFSLESEHLETIEHYLILSLCSMCTKTKSEFLNALEDVTEGDMTSAMNLIPDNYESLSSINRINALLGTSCAVEFDFEIFDTYEEYVKGLL